MMHRSARIQLRASRAEIETLSQFLQRFSGKWIFLGAFDHDDIYDAKEL